MMEIQWSRMRQLWWRVASHLHKLICWCNNTAGTAFVLRMECVQEGTNSEDEDDHVPWSSWYW